MSRAAAPIALVFWVLACALLAGCAAPGEPTPRHPVIPVAVADLAARQSGSEVVLTFSLPHQSTDHESLAEPPAIEIYRAALPPGATPDRKTPWRLVYTIPSERVDSYVKGAVLNSATLSRLTILGAPADLLWPTWSAPEP